MNNSTSDTRLSNVNELQQCGPQAAHKRRMGPHIPENSLLVSQLLLLCLMISQPRDVECTLSKLLNESNMSDLGPNVYHEPIMIDPKQFENMTVDTQLRVVSWQILINGDEEDVLDKQKLVESLNFEQKSVFRQAWDSATRIVAPVTKYVNLTRRYRSWFAEFNELKKDQSINSETKDLRSATEVLRSEYAKVDEELMAQKCSHEPPAEGSAGPVAREKPMNLRDHERVDFIVQVLELLIDRLEQRLVDIKANGFEGDLLRPDGNEENDKDTMLRLEQDQRIKLAMDRVRRIAAKSAGSVLANESKHLMKHVLFKALASAIKRRNHEGPFEDTLSLIEPVILLISDLNTPIVVDYLRDVRFRLALGIVHFINKNPTCKSS